MDDERDKTPKGRKPKPKASPTKNKSTPIAKKPRAGKSALPKVPKAKARRGRKPKEREDPYDADQVAKDAKFLIRFLVSIMLVSISFISNEVYSDAIMNPASALQSSAEDFRFTTSLILSY